MPPTKAGLRQQLKDIRLALTPEQVETKSRQISDRLVGLTDWQQFKSLHFFTPFSSLNEPNIASFISYLKLHHPHIKLFSSIKIDNKWQIVGEDRSETEAKVDLFIVPCLGFDNHLNRLGFGGGYYDKLLKDRTDAQKIGVSFEGGLVEQIPFEAHDIVMDLIASEDKIYR